MDHHKHIHRKFGQIQCEFLRHIEKPRRQIRILWARYVNIKLLLELVAFLQCSQDDF